MTIINQVWARDFKKTIHEASSYSSSSSIVYQIMLHKFTFFDYEDDYDSSDIQLLSTQRKTRNPQLATRNPEPLNPEPIMIGVKTMRIQTGQPAKKFKVEDIFGNQISLNDFKDKKLLLAFFRYASCPLCNLRVHQLIEHYPTFETRGLHLLAFFQSPIESIRKYVGKQNAPFAIIADPDHNVYREYGVETSWTGFMKGSFRLATLTAAARQGFFPGKMEGKKSLVPADFLIGPDLIVEKAYYGSDIADHMPIQEILSWL